MEDAPPSDVFNIEVAGDHLFPITDEGILVHNATYGTINAFRVARHMDMPVPRGGRESHQGVMSAWMKLPNEYWEWYAYDREAV
jgi:hypothetical protein